MSNGSKIFIAGEKKKFMNCFLCVCVCVCVFGRDGVVRRSKTSTGGRLSLEKNCCLTSEEEEEEEEENGGRSKHFTEKSSPWEEEVEEVRVGQVGSHKEVKGKGFLGGVIDYHIEYLNQFSFFG